MFAVRLLGFTLESPHEMMETLQSIVFPTTASIGEVERTVADWCARSEWTAPVSLDLSETTFIEVPSLLFLLALLSTRVRAALVTEVRIPRAKRTRDFLRVWDFDGAVRRVTGRSLWQLVNGDDRSYFGEDQDTYRNIPTVKPPHVDALQALLSARFFSLRVFRFDEDVAERQRWRDDWKRWHSTHAGQVLRHLFPGAANDVARVIVRESLLNALQHSGASAAAIASHLVDRDPEKQHLTIAVWDNGLDVGATLRGCLDAGASVRISQPKEHSRFLFLVDEEPGVVRPSDWTPDASIADAHLIASGILPGISRKLGPYRVSEEARDDSGSVPGMGLYSLVRWATRTFNGTVSYRSSRHFMTVSSPRTAELSRFGPHDYRIRIKACPASMPAFPGNILVARLHRASPE